MGALLTGVGIAALGNTLDTVLLRNGRSIAGIIPDCTIEERHKDELEITQNPVEQGTPISDHAFAKPCELVMRVAWSDSKSLPSLINDALNGTLAAGIDDVYQQLLGLQASPIQSFSISTGKRDYDNMVLKSLQVVTNGQTENVLMVEALFQEVIIVSTQAQSLSSLGSVANLASPQNSAPPAALGSVQLAQPNPVAGATISGQIP